MGRLLPIAVVVAALLLLRRRGVTEVIPGDAAKSAAPGGALPGVVLDPRTLVQGGPGVVPGYVPAAVGVVGKPTAAQHDLASRAFMDRGTSTAAGGRTLESVGPIGVQQEGAVQLGYIPTVIR